MLHLLSKILHLKFGKSLETSVGRSVDYMTCNYKKLETLIPKAGSSLFDLSALGAKWFPKSFVGRTQQSAMSGASFIERNAMKNTLRILHPLFIALLATLLPAQGLAQSGAPDLPNPGRTSVSREQQQQLGLQAASEVYKQMPVLSDNSSETQYIRGLGQRLVATIPSETSWPFEFHVIPQKEINAFALPGGEMFVNIGTITAADNEAQLAGVMAHEMAHVYMQHSAKQMQKAQLTQGLAGLAGAILGEKGGTFGTLAQAGVQVGAGMVMLKYSRSDEAQADAVGAIILYRAGYNPQALADFFKSLETQGGTGPQFMSDHPNPGNREAAIQKEIQGWPARTYQTSSPQFASVRQHATGVKAYTAAEIAQGAKTGQWTSLNQKGGAVFKSSGTGVASPAASASTSTAGNTVGLKDVMPSSKLVTSDLGPMKIARPENWDVIAPQQQGQSVTIAPRAGFAANGFGYGVAINGVSGSGGNATIDQMTAKIVSSLQGGGSDLKTIGNPTPINVAGVRGRSVIMQSTSPFIDAKGQSQKERDWLVTIPRQDGSVLYLVFVAPESDFRYFQPTFENMLKSVQF
jgi:beta-barrel assembly-enhancing protease